MLGHQRQQQRGKLRGSTKRFLAQLQHAQHAVERGLVQRHVRHLQERLHQAQKALRQRQLPALLVELDEQPLEQHAGDGLRHALAGEAVEELLLHLGGLAASGVEQVEEHGVHEHGGVRAGDVGDDGEEHAGVGAGAEVVAEAHEGGAEGAPRGGGQGAGGLVEEEAGEGGDEGFFQVF